MTETKSGRGNKRRPRKAIEMSTILLTSRTGREADAQRLAALPILGLRGDVTA
jgi:hypothetical protein